MEVGLKIKKYIEDNGISQAHIGRETGIDVVKLNLGLNGKRRFSFDEYALICGVLKVNTDFFVKPRVPKREEV